MAGTGSFGAGIFSSDDARALIMRACDLEHEQAQALMDIAQERYTVTEGREVAYVGRRVRVEYIPAPADGAVSYLVHWDGGRHVKSDRNAADDFIRARTPGHGGSIPDHRNDSGDHCSWSGTTWAADDTTCPQMCREASALMGE